MILLHQQVNWMHEWGRSSSHWQAVNMSESGVEQDIKKRIKVKSAKKFIKSEYSNFWNELQTSQVSMNASV